MALTLDDLVPGADYSSRHELRIAAPPAAVWDALQEIRLADTALSRTLMGIRLLPARLAGRSSRMASGRLLEEGPVPVLGIEHQRSVVAGGAMQPWKLSGGDDAPALDAAELRAFAEPGWVKAAFDFVLDPDGEGTRLSTETRISATDARTRARFGLYWMLIRVGSGLIRRDLLRAVARRAAAGPARGDGHGRVSRATASPNGPARSTSVPSMTASEFLAAFAAEVGVPAPTPVQSDALLEVASLAAHSSERLAAPLACWMGGVSGLPAAELLVAARRVAPAPPDAA